jgi:hypothetical protein
VTALNEGSATMQSPQFIVLVTTSLVSSLTMLDSNIMAASLPAIGRSLGASFTDIQWVSLLAACVAVLACPLTVWFVRFEDTAPSVATGHRPCKFVDCRDPL